MLRAYGLVVLAIAALFSASVIPIVPSYAQTNTNSMIELDPPRFVNSFGVPLDSIQVGDIVQVSADIDNLADVEQSFVYQVKVTAPDGKTSQTQWISGMVSAQDKINASISWIPKVKGTYTITVFAGASLDSLYKQNTVSVDVTESTPLQSCNSGLELIYKTSDNSPACVRPITAEILIERGGWHQTPQNEPVSWIQDSYSVTGHGTVRVTDDSMNHDPEKAESFEVHVWSESDTMGINLAVTETGKNTGVFDGITFFTPTDASAGHRIFVATGDKVTVQHNGFTSTAIIGEK